jgi:hypothetical protein
LFVPAWCGGAAKKKTQQATNKKKQEGHFCQDRGTENRIER